MVERVEARQRWPFHAMRRGALTDSHAMVAPNVLMLRENIPTITGNRG